MIGTFEKRTTRTSAFRVVWAVAPVHIRKPHELQTLLPVRDGTACCPGQVTTYVLDHRSLRFERFARCPGKWFDGVPDAILKALSSNNRFPVSFCSVFEEQKKQQKREFSKHRRINRGQNIWNVLQSNFGNL